MTNINPLITCPQCSGKSLLNDWKPTDDGEFVVCPNNGCLFDRDELIDEGMQD